MDIKRYDTLPPLTGEDGALLHLLRGPTASEPTVALLLQDDNDRAAELILTQDETVQLYNTVTSLVGETGRYRNRSVNVERLVIPGPEHTSLTVEYSNRGEPFREGLSFNVCLDDCTLYTFFEDHELPALLRFLDSCHFTLTETV